MSKTLLNAAMLKLQGEATEALGILEVLLNNPVAISEHTDYVGEIVDSAHQLAACEDALKALRQYCVPSATPLPPPANLEDIKKVTPEMSPTYKKSLEQMSDDT